MNISELSRHKITPEQKAKFDREQAEAQDVALNYLKEKFPGVDEKVFRTDYAGYLHEEIIDWATVYKDAIMERACENCKQSGCEIYKIIGSEGCRPLVKIAESTKGYKFLDVRWICGLGCKFQPLSGEFGVMFRKSGLKNSHVNMTFKNYECSKSTPETRIAKLEAMNASEEQSCLIIAGKPGTGKTHLAIAIAIRAMEHGRQAIFRLVSAMLDEIQAVIKENGDYDGLMKKFITVPCLILDDLGHENLTRARAGYLHRIIDERYTNDLQTIVTTNARSVEELCAWSNGEADYITPIISRLEKHGNWISIQNAEDFRMKKREVNNNAK